MFDIDLDECSLLVNSIRHFNKYDIHLQSSCKEIQYSPIDELGWAVQKYNTKVRLSSYISGENFASSKHVYMHCFAIMTRRKDKRHIL